MITEPKYCHLTEDDVQSYPLNSSALIQTTRCNELDPNKAAKILPNTLNISAFVSITSCTKLYFNMTVKIWLNALDISADTQIFSKNLLMIMQVGKYEFILALKISEFT